MSNIIDICCKDLRRYLTEALTTSRGDVISVKVRKIARMDLPQSDLVAYATCLKKILGQYRWGRSYVIPRDEVRRLLESFDRLCELAKQRRRSRPHRRKPFDRPQREEMRLIAVNLPRDLSIALDEYAAARGMSRSAVVRLAIQQLLAMRNVLEEINRAKNGKLEVVAMRLPASLLNAVNEYAAVLKTTRSAVIRYAIYKFLQKVEIQVAGHAAEGH